MLTRRAAVLALVVAGAVVGTSSPALAHETTAHADRVALAAAPATEGEADSMEFVANLPHELAAPTDAQNGSDIEFMTLGGRDYALAGTLSNGLQITDVTDPAAPVRAAVYDCQITQGDIQVFRQGDRVLATYTADRAIAPAGDGGVRTETNQRRFGAQCVTEANAAGFDLDGSELGTFLVDLTDPTNPTTVSFLEVPRGSHNQTVHPSGDYLYNSNSDLITSARPTITIHDISDPAEPRKVQDFSLPFAPLSLGSESHDIFFNGDGTRAYVAALSQTLILDTSDPEAPVELSQILDPSIQVVHQSDLVRLPREDGTERDLLIITDERAGAATSAECPGGGLHVYDITGAKELEPEKLGAWFIPRRGPSPNQVCTSHVLRIHPHQQLLTIAWYTAGVRVLDISGLAEFEGSPTQVAFGEGIGMKEVGSYVLPDADTWSFKTNRIDGDGSFFGFGNDLARGLDVYRFDGQDGLDRQVPVLAPEDLAAEGCAGVPVATAYVDRAAARDVHERAIDCVISREIARGSVQGGERVFRPTEDVTRAQMATFVLGALRAAGIDHELPEPKADAFDDVEGSVHQEAIETLAAIGVVEGTTGDRFVPGAPITRAQVASFTVRAAQYAATKFGRTPLTASGGPQFTDVPAADTHADNIAIGADNGLFSGTTPTTFSPAVTVKRDQMASFMRNLLDVAGRDNATPKTGTSTG